MGKIIGKNVVLNILLTGSPEIIEPIACGRTCTLITTAQTAGKSTTGSGTWQEFKALVNGWTLSADGIASIGDNMSLATLRGLQFALQNILVSFEEAYSGTTIYYSGLALITSVQSSANYNDAETFSVQLQGTGQLFQSRLFQITRVQADTPSAGQTTLTFSFDGRDMAPTYTIRITNITDSVVTTNSGGNSPRTIVVDSDDSYSFALKSEPSGSYSPEIYWP